MHLDRPRRPHELVRIRRFWVGTLHGLLRREAVELLNHRAIDWLEDVGLSASASFSEHVRKRALDAMAFWTQGDVDAAFADLDELLAVRQPPALGHTCRNCGACNFVRGANEGHCQNYYDVCGDCGCVSDVGFGATDQVRYPLRHSTSNYKRIHHWHERVSQLLLLESSIPHEDFLRIAHRLLDGSHTVINKDVIRGVLRSLNMQLYIEKWLQIIQRVTGIEPPKPGAKLLEMLDMSFTELQQPFAHFKTTGRKNFLNYNYVFCRLFQRLGCAQFCMFFPLIKSRQKLRTLDEMWEAMVANVGWEVKPLQQVAPFAVKLEQPDLLLRQIIQRGEPAVPAATHTAHSQTGFRRSDQRLLRELSRQKRPKRRRLDQPEPELKRLGTSVKRPRTASAVRLRRLIR